MERLYGLDALTSDATSVVTVGTFDGVHRGHQALLSYLLRRARAQSGTSVAISFDPHPREVVRGEAVPLLTTIEERADLLADLGVERFVVLPFTEAFSRLSPEAFVEEVLVRHVGLREIVIGYDHGFGRGRAGDSELLERLGARHDFAVDVIPAQIVQEHVVSSSEIRHHLVDEGNAALAAELLGRPYHLHGEVVRGDGRGRGIGYPTANLAVAHPRKVIPKDGVYAVRVTEASGALDPATPGMMNIGHRPTFDGVERRIEVHLFDVEADLYGKTLRVEFVERLRDEKRFEGVEALMEQLSRDEARCKAVLAALS